MVERRVGGSRRGDSPSSRSSVRSSDGSTTNSSITPLLGDGFHSANSQDATRSLGSRGSSVCDESADDCDNISVVVRCRPLNDKELKKGDEQVVNFPGEGQLWVNMDGLNGQPVNKPKAFTYNIVFEPEANQEDIIEHSGIQKLLDMAIDGFSCTVFCYGQTGSGKTHTLTGPPHLFDDIPDVYSEDHGLIFRAFVYLFNQIQNRNDREFTLTASYLEIYNEKVIDLLNISTSNKPLQVRWDKKKSGFFVENLFSIECAELDDLMAVLEEGLRNRAVAAHNMNEFSSRSHTILTVNITSEQKAGDTVFLTKNGKINFVDLAGSEMTKKTNSEGKTLEEANNINKSLMNLGLCISALSDQKKKDGHIPYRDSKLTKLLSDSLSGNGVTLMIACVSPAKSNISETLNTLRYAARAKRIHTKPIIIMDPKEKVILSLQREVSLLQEENTHLKSLLDIGTGGNGKASLELQKKLAAGEFLKPNTENGVKGGTKSPTHVNNGRRGSIRVDNDKLSKLNNVELVSLVQHYMTEHDTVRKENKELQDITSALIRDQELVCKENERLLRKLEAVNSGTYRGNIVPVRPLHSAGKEKKKAGRSSAPKEDDPMNSTQVWVNPNDTANKKNNRASKPPSKIPPSINKELEKRRIGKSMNDLSSSGRGSSRGSEEGDAPAGKKLTTLPTKSAG